MVMKCYNKPNRSQIRTFKPCDAARIAREVVRDDKDSTPEKVLACIAKGLGFTHISLSRTEGRPIESAINLGKSVKLIESLVIALQKVVRALGLRDIAARIGAILDLLGELSKLIDESFFQPDQAAVDDVLPETYCNCKKVVNNGSK